MPTEISLTNASGSTRRPYFSESSTTFLRATSFCRNPALQGSTPSMMLSSTEKHSTSLKCWWTMPMPRSFASLGLLILTSLPFFLMTPCSGWYRPNRTLMRVDLPAPFSPSRACTSPLRSWRVMLSFALIPGNSLVIFSISMTKSSANPLTLLSRIKVLGLPCRQDSSGTPAPQQNLCKAAAAHRAAYAPAQCAY